MLWSFAFGLARDLWNPFGLRDRGLLLIFGGATAVLFLWMMQAPLSYGGLLVGMFLVPLVLFFVRTFTEFDGTTADFLGPWREADKISL